METLDNVFWEPIANMAGWRTASRLCAVNRALRSKFIVHVAHVLARDWRICVDAAQLLERGELVPESSTPALRRMSARIFDQATRPRSDVYEMLLLLLLLSSCDERQPLQELRLDIWRVTTSFADDTGLLFNLFYSCNIVTSSFVNIGRPQHDLTKQQRRLMPESWDVRRRERAAPFQTDWDQLPPIVASSLAFLGRLSEIGWPALETKQSYLEWVLVRIPRHFGSTLEDLQTLWIRHFVVPADVTRWTWHSPDDETLRVIAKTFELMIRDALHGCPYQGEFPESTYQPPEWSEEVAAWFEVNRRLSERIQTGQQVSIETICKQLLGNATLSSEVEPEAESRKQHKGPLRAFFKLCLPACTRKRT